MGLLSEHGPGSLRKLPGALGLCSTSSRGHRPPACGCHPLGKKALVVLGPDDSTMEHQHFSCVCVHHCRYKQLSAVCAPTPTRGTHCVHPIHQIPTHCVHPHPLGAPTQCVHPHSPGAPFSQCTPTPTRSTLPMCTPTHNVTDMGYIKVSSGPCPKPCVC